MGHPMIACLMSILTRFRGKRLGILGRHFSLRIRESSLKTGNVDRAGKGFHSKIVPEKDILHRRVVSIQSPPAA
jgi:hypothetical protein